MNLSVNSIDYLKAFIGGIGVSLTPCLYPLIPVTAGYIGATASGSKLKGFLLSFVYATGVAVTYSCLGLLASLTGTIFGRIASYSVTYFFVGGIIIVFGFSMLDLFALPFFQLIKISRFKKHSYLNVFLLGLSSGLVASPCLSPVLGTIMVVLAAKKNLLYGATLLLSFAYGMGFVLILVGTFSTILTSLPRSGRFMVYIKRIGAFILIAMGLYFIYTGIRRM